MSVSPAIFATKDHGESQMKGENEWQVRIRKVESETESKSAKVN